MTSGPEVTRWKREEARRVLPFATFDDLLDQATFSPEVTVVASIQTKHYLPRATLWQGLRPSVTFPNWDDGSLNALGSDLSRFELAISIRDYASKNYWISSKWTLNDVPETWQSTEPISSSSGFDVLALICLKESHVRQMGQPNRKGSIVASRVFSVRSESETLTFPIKFVDFEDRGLPSEALWMVHFFGEEVAFARPVNEVLELWLNKRAETRLVQASNSTLGTPLLQTIAADVYYQVLERALADHANSDLWEEGSLGYQLVVNLEEAAGLDLSEQRRLVAADPQFLRVCVQAMYGLTTMAASLDLRR